MQDVIMPLIAAAAIDASIPVGLALSVAKVESNLNPRAVSSAGAKGLFQMMPATGARYGLQTDEDFFSPVKNARAGCSFLRDLRSSHGPWWRVLAAFNWGPGRVLRTPNFYEWPEPVRTYVERVYRLWRGPKKLDIPVEVRTEKKAPQIWLPSS